MFIGSKTEFDQLCVAIKAKKCVTETDVRNALEVYFTGIQWSLLKVEWERITEKEKAALAEKIYFKECK